MRRWRPAFVSVTVLGIALFAFGAATNTSWMWELGGFLVIAGFIATLFAS